jgi:uncharacterized protein with GYD domain
VPALLLAGLSLSYQELNSLNKTNLTLAVKRKRRCSMPKYLIQGSYTEEGLKGLLKEGGSKRREATEQGLKAIGGTLEAYYYAFGDDDYYVIVDLPDNVNATAVSLVANASGAIKNKTTVLITPEEVDQAVDQAAKVADEYRPPGQ